ncbi:MAG: iron chaperone [Candidatus Dormibacterales bacterium]
MKAEAAKADGKTQLLAAIARMQEPDRTIAKKVHALITAATPALTPKTWYGMPAYAKEDGGVICYFQNAGKFKVRYQTLGFSDKASIDDGAMWPIQYALTKLTATEEAKITALVKKAVR